MADDQISQLPVGGTLTGPEQVPLSYPNPPAVGGYTTYRTSVTAIAQFAQQGGLIPTAPGQTGQVLVGETAQPPTWTDPGQTGEILIGNTAADPSWLPGGLTGQFLTGNTGGNPVWAYYDPGQFVSSISFDASGLTPATATTGDVVVGGTLNVAYGGTGSASFTTGGLLYGAGASAVQATAAGGAGAIFVVDSGGNYTWLAPGTSGQLLQSGGAGNPPSWTAVPGTGVATISFDALGFTPNTATAGSVTVAGTLNPAHGGTGLTLSGTGALYSSDSATFTVGTLPIAQGGTGRTSLSGANHALYTANGTTITDGVLPTNAGGTALSTFGAANRALYSTSASALTAGTLPVAAGGTGATAATGSGNVVLATGATLATATLNNPTINNATFSPALTTGLTGFRNRIVNGTFYFDQRNAGAAQTFTAGAAGKYCVDRMYGYCTGANVTGQRIAQNGATTSPEQLAYQFSGAASVTKVVLGQRIASRDCFDLAGQSVTVSFNVRTAGSGSPPSSVSVALAYANAGDNFSTVTAIGTTVIGSIGSTETNVSATFSVPSGAITGLQVEISVGALLASQTFSIGNLQLEGGASATAFERRPNMFESVLCRQRFETSYCGDFALGTVTQTGAEQFVWDLGSGGPKAGYSGGSAIRLLPKAQTPTVTLYSPATGASGKIRNVNSGADVSLSAANIGKEAFQWTFTDSTAQTGIDVMFHWAAECEL